MLSSSQLTLSVTLRDDATFANFISGDNQAVVDCLQACIRNQANADSLIYVWGESGSGCSHLLQACCHAMQAQEQASAYLPLTDYQHLDPKVLTGMEMLALVALDNIEAVLGLRQWEEALFHFYNRARDHGLKLIVGASKPPAQLPCLLADLQSRLSWGLVFKLNELADEDKLLALITRAKRRGMNLSHEAANYLLQHYTRNMRYMMAALEQLDAVSLRAQRRLTIPFIKAVLEL